MADASSSVGDESPSVGDGSSSILTARGSGEIDVARAQRRAICAEHVAGGGVGTWQSRNDVRAGRAARGHPGELRGERLKWGGRFVPKRNRDCRRAA